MTRMRRKRSLTYRSFASIPATTPRTTVTASSSLMHYRRRLTVDRNKKKGENNSNEMKRNTNGEKRANKIKRKITTTGRRTTVVVDYAYRDNGDYDEDCGWAGVVRRQKKTRGARTGSERRCTGRRPAAAAARRNLIVSGRPKNGERTWCARVGRRENATAWRGRTDQETRSLGRRRGWSPWCAPRRKIFWTERRYKLSPVPRAAYDAVRYHQGARKQTSVVRHGQQQREITADRNAGRSTRNTSPSRPVATFSRARNVADRTASVRFFLSFFLSFFRLSRAHSVTPRPAERQTVFFFCSPITGFVSLTVLVRLGRAEPRSTDQIEYHFLSIYSYHRARVRFFYSPLPRPIPQIIFCLYIYILFYIICAYTFGRRVYHLSVALHSFILLRFFFFLFWEKTTPLYRFSAPLIACIQRWSA